MEFFFIYVLFCFIHIIIMLVFYKCIWGQHLEETEFEGLEIDDAIR